MQLKFEPNKKHKKPASKRLLTAGVISAPFSISCRSFRSLRGLASISDGMQSVRLRSEIGVDPKHRIYHYRSSGIVGCCGYAIIIAQ